MISISEEAHAVIVQFFLVDPLEFSPIVHPKKKEKPQGALIKELETMIRDYEELEAGIDLAPYHEALESLKKIKGKELYQVFLDGLLRPYGSL